VDPRRQERTNPRRHGHLVGTGQSQLRVVHACSIAYRREARADLVRNPVCVSGLIRSGRQTRTTTILRVAEHGRHRVTPKIQSFRVLSAAGGSNPWAFQPALSDDFHLEMVLTIGPSGSRDAEYFSVAVATPKSLARLVAAEGPLFGRHLLVVANWEVQTVVDTLRDRIESIEAATWAEAREKLRRLLNCGE
jgi:hypothetical protein